MGPLSRPAIVPSLFARHQEVHASEFFQVTEEGVRRWRMDPLSLMEDRAQHLSAAWNDTKSAWPALIMAIIAKSRASFLLDIVSDLVVAQQLWEFHQELAITTCLIVALPYLMLPAILGPSGLQRLLCALHPSLKTMLQSLGHRPVLEGIVFAALAVPGFLLVDVSFVLQHLISEPATPALFHYWTLRSLVEVAWESNLQVALQSYIWIRQENLFGVMAPFSDDSDASVNIVFLGVSIASSALATLEGLSKLSTFAALQTGSSRWRFVQAMLRGGQGLAPSNLLNDMLRQKRVEVAEDLTSLSRYGWDSLCRAAGQSKVLRSLTFDGRFLQKFVDSTDFIGARNSLGVIFQNQKLQELHIANLPHQYQQHVDKSTAAHLALERSELRRRLAADPVFAAAVQGDVEPLRLPTRPGLLQDLARCGQARALQVLLTEAKHSTEETARALWFAGEEGHGAAVELLLRAKADPKQVNPRNGAFPLLMAANYGHTEPVRLLLEAKADPKQVNPQKGTFPLLVAAGKGHTEPVRLLLEAKAAPEQRHPQFVTPLELASGEGFTEVVEALRRGSG
ncbi:CTTNBP2 [Symbiodinium sp. CCMP2456]|nr:CTTNBP2 [Symbiodinium sp. CCMP2456]